MDREMQFSKINSNEFNGDRDNIYNWYGSNYRAEDGTLLERDLGDGEKNAGFVDWDGRWTKDGEGPAYIFPREATTVNTGCYDQENISGMMEPLGKVCPIDLEIGFFGASVRVKHQTSGQSFQHLLNPFKIKNLIFS